MAASASPVMIGAWLPTDWHRPLTFDEQSLIEQSNIDLLLLPENHDSWANRSSWKQLADKMDTAIYAGLEDNGWTRGLYYNPDDGQERVYTKHSTSDQIALECDDWTPEEYLHTLGLNGVTVGTTICHDHYLSPFMRYEGLNDADALLNLSASPVVRRKWGEVLQARAIENSTFVVCTMHGRKSDGSTSKTNKAHVFAFDPFGDPLPLTELETDRTVAPFDTEPDNLYSFTVEPSKTGQARQTLTQQMQRKSIDRVRANVFGAPQPSDTTLDTDVADEEITLAYHGDEATIDVGESQTLRFGDETVSIVSLQAEEAFDPERLYESLLGISGIEDHRILVHNHWNRLEEHFLENTLEPVLRARCVEWCSPVLLTASNCTRAYQLANKHKDTHELPKDDDGQYNFELRRAFGVASAFKPVNGRRDQLRELATECTACRY